MDSDSESNSFFLDDDLEYISAISLAPPNIVMPDNHSGSSLDLMSDDSWCNTSEAYLRELVDKGIEEANNHKENRDFYAMARHSTGIPSCLIGVVMASLTENTPDYIHKGAFITNALVCSLQYYFDFAHKQKINNKAYDDYTEFINEVNQVLAMPKNKRQPARITIDNLSKEYIRIQSASP